MQNLRAALSQCSTMRFTNGSGSILLADSLYKVGSVCGIVSEDVPIAAEGVLITRAPSAGVVLPCPAGATGVFAVGEMVYYDTSEGVVVNYAAKAGNILCGFALEIAELADEEVRVDFDGIIGKGATE